MSTTTKKKTAAKVPAKITKVIDPAMQEQAETLVSDAVQEWRLARETGERAMVAASVATYAAFDAGLIGKDAKWSQDDYAALFGITSGYVTLLRRNGRALALGLVTPESESFRLLSSKAGANIGAVGKVIESPKPTKAALAKALGEAFTPDGKKRPAKKTTDPSKSGIKSDAATRVEQVVAEVSALLADASRLTPESVLRIEVAATALLDAVAANRSKRTKKTAAKKTA